MNVFSLILAVVLVLTLCPSAKAVVREDGAFVPTQCGRQEAKGLASDKISEICIGRINDAASTPAVAFRMTDGTEQIFRITNVSEVPHLIEVNAYQYVFELVDATGVTSAMNVSRFKGDTVAHVAGSLSLNEGQADYVVTKFQPMFVIQGL